MTRLWVLTAILFALAIAACGPDCDGYCRKIQECAITAQPPLAPVDVAGCVLGCNDSGGDRSSTISCYIDHTCSDIRAGHCSVTGKAP